MCSRICGSCAQESVDTVGNSRPTEYQLADLSEGERCYLIEGGWPPILLVLAASDTIFLHMIRNWYCQKSKCDRI